ncbi:MAG TPA: hypothetical protein PLU53_09750 [Bacteroidia bacterium]|nr:hypothetical protein [Bacteroidia bacterium]
MYTFFRLFFFPGTVIFLLLFSVRNGYAQKKTGIRAPKQVVDSFHKFYPYIKKPLWVKNGENYEARFPWGETASQLVFDKQGNWQYRRVVVGRYEMPGSITNFTEQNFPGIVPDIVYLTFFPEAKQTFYELHIAGRIFNFDSMGKLTKEVDVK